MGQGSKCKNLNLTSPSGPVASAHQRKNFTKAKRLPSNLPKYYCVKWQGLSAILMLFEGGELVFGCLT